MEREYPLKLSIIVPVYNVERYLERCVESLLNQDIDKAEYEIILINDGSTDRSYEIAQQLANEKQNIVLLSQENRGQSVARNVGMDAAEGKYIMFVDSDDFITSNVLGKLIEKADEQSLDMLFYNNVRELSDGRQVVRKKHPFENDVIYDGEFLVLHGIEVSVIWLNIYASKFLFDSGVRFFEGIIHQDVDFDYKLYPHAKRVMFTDIIVYHYCINSESSIHTKMPQKVREIIESDFYVASNIWKYSVEHNYSERIQRHYSRQKNSITLSALLLLVKNHYLDMKTKGECLATAKQLGVYPIHGITNSFKTTLLSILLNIEWLYKCLLRYNSRK